MALPLLQAQNTPNPAPVTPKWEFGLRSGAGFHTSNLFLGIDPNGRNSPMEYYGGAYLTRNLSNRWSLRSELSAVLYPYNNLALTVGLFPRYRLTNWLSLEAGIESKQVIAGYDRNNAKIWLGTAFHWKKLELNFRFAPGYTPSSRFSRGAWHNTIQLGLSYKLSKTSKLLNKKW